MSGIEPDRRPCLFSLLLLQEVYDYAHKALGKVERARLHSAPSTSGVCSGCQAASVAARALAQCARKQRGSRDDITVLLANLGAACSCTKPPVTLSSATLNSGLLASTSTGGVATAGKAGATVASGVQLHSSPAALGDQPTAGAEACTNPQQHSKQQPKQQHSEVLHRQAKHAKQSYSPQQPPHKCRGGPPHAGGLLLQPSVCPGTACPMQASAVAFDSGPHHAADAMQSGLLSDLALSSPFAMMLGGAVAEIEVEVEVVDASLTSDSNGVVSGGSAPPGFVAGLRKRSLSMALANTRSCGSVGAPQLRPMGSSEQPVVVLT